MAEKKNETQNEQDKEKKKKGVIIGVIGVAAAAAVAVPLSLKGCAPGERSFTVTFLTDDEVQNFEEKSMNVKDGTRVGDLKGQLAPIDGYEIEGFYKDQECTQPFDDNDIVTDDTIIYVKYQERQITLIFHNDGNAEDNTFEPMQIGYFEKLTKVSLPTAKDYTTSEYKYSFNGWLTLDRKPVDFSADEMKTGADLLEIDADGEIDLYADFTMEHAYLEFTKNAEGTGYIVTAYTNNEVTDIIIPDNYDGLPVVEIANMVFMNTSITSLTLGENIKTIGNSVFTGTAALENFYWNAIAADDLSSSPFYGMGQNVGGVNFVFGEKVTRIPENCLSGPFIKTLIISDSVTEIGEKNWYSNCPTQSTGTLEKVVFGNGVKKILGSMFSSCSKLKEVIIGQNIESIGSYAFAGCSSIERLVFPDSLKSIGDTAFAMCSGLTEVVFGKGLEIIDRNAFGNCSGLKNIILPNSLISIGDTAFVGCSSLQGLIIPDSVKSIGSTSLGSCYALKYIVVGSGLENVAGNVLGGTKLDAIYYHGTEEDWNKIQVGDYNNDDWKNTIPRYYFSETEPEDDGNYWHYVPGENGELVPTPWAKKD